MKQKNDRLKAVAESFCVLFLFAAAGSCSFYSPVSADSEKPGYVGENTVLPEEVQEAGGADGAPLEGDGFNYLTHQWVQVEMKSEIPEAQIQIYDENERMLAKVVTDENGAASALLSVAKTSTLIIIKSSTIGLPDEMTVEIESGIANIDLRRPESRAYSLNSKSTGGAGVQQISGFPEYRLIGSWSSSGAPDYLDSPVEISSDLISEIDSILPERQPVPEYRPQYLADNLDTDLHITKDAEVFVTFVHEGAGYRNTLGFYTYITSEGPPKALEDADITLIFPNISYNYSGGGLYTGDTVNIGTIPAGTSVGWVLLSDAYNRWYKAVSGGQNAFYSENSLNPDSPPYQQHLIQIDLGDTIVLAFEDLVRPGGDNDFNDAVFTVSSNPVEAIERGGLVTDTSVNYTAPEPDDGGIELQEQPLFDISGYQFFPGLDEFGTLAFEDLWPHKGDYDFNDLVIDYNIIETLDNSNKIMQIQLTFKIVGILASMHNGFGVQLGIPPEMVASVTGGRYTRGYTELEGNGVEKRQQKAVIIIFEDAQAHYNVGNPDESELITVSINLIEGVDRSQLGFAPYNPFIMSNGERGREVHLPGYQATSLVHSPYFGSEDDNSVTGTSLMYKTQDDLPWAIHLPEPFAYPPDSIRISDAFMYFVSWVESNGLSNIDWYMDKPGYRDSGVNFRI